tara:strand:+ start:10123 stop:10665 length:543 start_codon:yes stop_codon:yes gene_type:complete
MECPVCFKILDDNTKTSTKCNHIFCVQCIEKLFENRKNVCPLCRKEITEYYNKNEKVKIIFKNVENPINNNLILLNQRLLLKYKFKFFLVSLLSLFELYLIITERINYNDLYLSHEECDSNLSNLTNNYNNLIIEYDNCITDSTYLDDNYLSEVFVFNSNNNGLISCLFPIYYIRKCFNI